MQVVHGLHKYHNIITCPALVSLLRDSAYKCGLLDTPLKCTEILPPIDVASVSHVMPTLRPMFYIGTDHTIGTQEFRNVCGETDLFLVHN